MAVTRDGVSVRCLTFPGNTGDTSIIRTIKDELGGWNLHRMVWVADRGFASAGLPHPAGGHYIHAEKLRHTNTEAAAALARPVQACGREPAGQGGPGRPGGKDDGVRAQRFVVCHNPDQAERNAQVRANLVKHLEGLIAGSDEWAARRRDELVGPL